MTKKVDLTIIESEPNFHLIIANSNVEHSTESVVARGQTV